MLGHTLFLVPKLQLGNPLGSKALLCKAHLEYYEQVKAIWRPSRAWAKNIRSQAGAWEQGKPVTETLKNYGGQGGRPPNSSSPLTIKADG